MIACVAEGTYELVIKRSRFIATSHRIETRDDVKCVIDVLKSQHPDARHVCYGFIADEKGDDFGYDDNGEPSGTAGKPIYSALAAEGARKSLIVVVRYFGGIKLGAGGLTRAYRQSAADLIEKVGLVQAEKHTAYNFSADGDTYKKLSAILRALGCDVSNVRYESRVTCTVTVPTTRETELLRAVGGLNMQCERAGERYIYS